MMKTNYKDEAQSFVKKYVLDRNLTLPIDVEMIAEELGISLIQYEFDEDISAILFKGENGAMIIGFNPNEIPERIRFTISHEIGHYWLHYNKSNQEVFMDKAMFRKNIATYSEKEERIEREANHFAACLLMPSELLRDEINRLNPSDHDDDNIKSLAKTFNVSERAMTYRLINLGFYKKSI